MTTSVVHLIPKSVNEYLKLKLQEEIDASDETRAGVVRLGLLQDSPTRGGINIMSYFNDPDDDTQWKHSLVGDHSTLVPSTNPPPFQVGGGSMWYRRYTTKLIMFFRVGATREKAEELSAIILSRAEKSIEDAPLPNDADDFGEIALKQYVSNSSNIEGGGTGQMIFYGKIWWSVLTEKS